MAVEQVFIYLILALSLSTSLESGNINRCGNLCRDGSNNECGDIIQLFN